MISDTVFDAPDRDLDPPRTEMEPDFEEWLFQMDLDVQSGMYDDEGGDLMTFPNLDPSG